MAGSLRSAEEVVSAAEVDASLDSILEELKQNSPAAIRFGLEAYDKMYPTASQHQYLFDMLQKTIRSKDGQEGLKAFREKRKPQWTGE